MQSNETPFHLAYWLCLGKKQFYNQLVSKGMSANCCQHYKDQSTICYNSFGVPFSNTYPRNAIILIILFLEHFQL